MIALDIIGALYRDDETQIPGWHVNTTPEGLAAFPALAPFVVSPDPTRLRRVWAGDDPENPTLTVALRFADEAEALSALPPIQGD